MTDSPSWTVTVASQVAELSGCADMTFPAYAGLLAHIETDPTLLAVVARAGTDPAGLALTQITPETERAVLRSLFTAPALRRQGIAAALLACTEQHLRELGVSRITGTYATNPAIDALLVHSGWDQPRRSMYLFHVGQAAAEAMERSPLFRPTVLAAGQEIVPWGKLSRDERTAIYELADSFEVPPGLSPTTEPDRLDPDMSLVLRINGEVFIWVMAHRMSANRVRFSGLYARPDCPVKGLGFRLLIESLRRYVAHIRAKPGDDATWGCHADMPMAGFCLRRMVPYLPGTAVTETWASGKDLT